MSVANVGYVSGTASKIQTLQSVNTPVVDEDAETYATLLQTVGITDNLLIILMSANLTFTSISPINIIDIRIQWSQDGYTYRDYYRSAPLFNNSPNPDCYNYSIPIQTLISLTEIAPNLTGTFRLQATCFLQLAGTWSATAGSTSFLILGKHSV